MAHFTFCISALQELLICLAQALHWFCIDPFRHSVKVDQEAEENLVRRGAIFVNSAEIAENGYAGHILSMKGQDTRGFLIQAYASFCRVVAMKMLVLAVVCRGDFSQ